MRASYLSALAALLAALTGCHNSSRTVVTSAPAPQAPARIHRAAPLGNNRIQIASSTAAKSKDLVIATDPDHDSVWIAQQGGGVRQIELGVGEEPSDIAIDTFHDEDVAYVSLHGGGAVLSIPLAHAADTQTPFTRLPVCAQPRGMDVFPQMGGSTLLYVACADGVLVTVDTSSLMVISRLALADDLKDVVLTDPDTALVTQFRSANVLQVDLTTGTAVSEALPGTADRVADVAWQMVPLAWTSATTRQGAFIAHQLASTKRIKITTSCTCRCDLRDGRQGRLR